MESVLFSIMCTCKAEDLFILSGLCRDTRSIFVRKSFWKARFALLGIQHEEPSLEVYLRYLRLQEKLPLMHSSAVFDVEIDLDAARSFIKVGVAKELIDNIDRAEEEGRPGKRDYFLRELKLMLSLQVTLRLEEGGYILSYGLEQKITKAGVLNILLRFCHNA